jgi:superfamily I DNA and/or RNA helicase
MNINTWTEHLSHWRTFLSERLTLLDDVGEQIKVERQLKTIERVRYAAVLNPKVLIEFINPSDLPLPHAEDYDYFLNLNDSQKKAVEIALGNNALSLIQGPPGTGKTQVIAEICLQLYRKNPNVRILVCSETHVAVNNLISRISEYDDSIRIVRIRDKEQNSAVDEFSPEAIISTYKEWLQTICNSKDIINIISETLSDYEDRSLEKALALSANIAGMTCNRINAYEFESSSEMFDVVIIDEVCKATLPEILAPLTIAQKAILVGDPKQLPPVFCSEEIEVIRSIEKCNLQSYLYIDDLFLKSPNTTLLDTQYRMTNRIGDLIGTLFYDGALKNGRNIDGDKDIIWVDYTPTELWPRYEVDSDESPKIFNLDECRIITGILNDLDRSIENFTSVAVIAPYRHQVVMLRRLLQNEHFNNLDVNVDTIDGFQGKECDVVVFSLTRTIGSFRFLADVRRLNVALSRARNKLYIVGNLSYATNHKLLKSIMEYCEKLHCDENIDLTS